MVQLASTVWKFCFTDSITKGSNNWSSVYVIIVLVLTILLMLANCYYWENGGPWVSQKTPKTQKCQEMYEEISKCLQVSQETLDQVG